VLNCRAMCSVAGYFAPAIWVFSISGFHRFIATKPVGSETSKQNGGQFGDHSSIRDSWPIAFSGYPRGPRVNCETTCPRATQCLLYRLRLALEPECLENPTATAREDPQDGADSIRDTQAVCGVRYWASKHTPLFHTINTMVAIFLARVRRAISGRMPLANNSA
jgi:hypothetical protein